MICRNGGLEFCCFATDFVFFHMGRMMMIGCPWIAVHWEALLIS